MNSFQSIAISRNTSLAIVAPGIAEALFATALGLLAAIPAVVAFNKFNNYVIASGSIIGEVKGKDVIMIDDLCDTGGTLVKAVNALLDAGARSVRAIVTHGVMSGPAYERIMDSKIKEFICSDTLDQQEDEHDMDGKLTVISTAGQLAYAIIGINNDTSLNL